LDPCLSSGCACSVAALVQLPRRVTVSSEPPGGVTASLVSSIENCIGTAISALT
jgi:hypothetical protein